MSLRTDTSTGQRKPSSSEADLARVRDNQRRSRARRKEYLQELESKLRKSEALGVQASVDIQLAARNVKEENVRLRDENGRLKEENERLRQMLKRDKTGAMAMTGDRVTTGSCISAETDGVCVTGPRDVKGAQATPATASSFNSIKPFHGDAIANSDVCSRTVTQQLYTPTSATTPLNEPDRTSRSRDIAQTASTTLGHTAPTHLVTSPQDSCARSQDYLQLNDDTSSCEYAAHIITSMRADVSTDDVRADLGCASDIGELRKCKVDNSRLFTTVDRYTR